MISVRWLWLSVASWLAAASSVQAADRDIHLHISPPIQKDVAAMPLIAEPTDSAEQRINAALHQMDGRLRKALTTCKGDDGAPGNWQRTIDVPMHGPGYLSLVITDDAFCGGAHPSTATMSIVYDLVTGNPVNWTHLLPSSLTGKVALTKGMDETRMVTLESKRLYALYIAGYDPGPGTAEDRASCKEAVQNIGDTDPPAMMAWLSAKPAGLAVQYDLSHVVQACAVPVVIPIATLRAEGAKPAMLDAIATAGGK